MQIRRDAKTGHLESSATRRHLDYSRYRRMDLRQSDSNHLACLNQSDACGCDVRVAMWLYK